MILQGHASLGSRLALFREGDVGWSPSYFFRAPSSENLGRIKPCDSTSNGTEITTGTTGEGT